MPSVSNSAVCNTPTEQSTDRTQDGMNTSNYLAGLCLAFTCGAATAGIVIAMLFVSIPFLINSAKDGFKNVDTRLEKVARTLGASPRQVFLRISFATSICCSTSRAEPSMRSVQVIGSSSTSVPRQRARRYTARLAWRKPIFRGLP